MDRDKREDSRKYIQNLIQKASIRITEKLVYPLRKTEAMEKISGQEYKAIWRGDSVIRITPAGKLYPIFERGWMERDDAPTMASQPYKGQKGGKVHW